MSDETKWYVSVIVTIGHLKVHDFIIFTKQDSNNFLNENDLYNIRDSIRNQEHCSDVVILNAFRIEV